MQRLIATALLLVTPLAAKPLFGNSVVSNDIDFIRTDDPSVPFKLSETGRARKEMPDKRSDQLFLDEVHTLSLNYDDTSSIEIWASPLLKDRASAIRYATLVGAALGKLPTPMRKKLSHVVIHAGDETAYAEEEGRFFVLYTKNIEKRISTHDLEETVFHESVHATLEAEHAKCPEWIKAQKADTGFITAYAEALPQKEDLPESALFAYTLTKHPGRLPAKVEEAVRKLMPHRLEYLRLLFESLEAKSQPKVTTE